MKLYRKTLTSLDELEREKIRLRYERKGTKSKHLLPDIKKARKKLTGGGSKNKDKGGGSNLMGIALGLLNGGSPVQTILSLAGPVTSLLFKGKDSAPKRFLGRVIRDIAISYVIGKGLQLAVKGTRTYIRSKRAKQEAV